MDVVLWSSVIISYSIWQENFEMTKNRTVLFKTWLSWPKLAVLRVYIFIYFSNCSVQSDSIGHRSRELYYIDTINQSINQSINQCWTGNAEEKL